MKKTLIALLFVTLTIALFSQELKVPKNYKLDKAEDYAPYEQDVIDCVEWLIKTPTTKQTTKRKEVNKFLLHWLTGSPDVHIEINQEIATFMTSPDLLMIFMGGWAKNSIETKDYNNKIAGSMAGIESVIDFYTNNKEVLGKDKNVEKYIKMKKKGKLEEYIKENV